MLLVCPSCRTRYVVPDSAIGAAGRQVRCANCKHSWFQDGQAPATSPAPQVAAPIIPPPAPPSVPPPFPESSHPPAAPSPVAEASEETSKPAGTEEGTAPPPAQPGFAAFDHPQPNLSDTEPATRQVEEPDAAPVFHRPLPDAAVVDAPVYADSEADPKPSQFAHEPPFKPRRNPARLWTLAALAFALLIATIGGALWYIGIPATVLMTGREPDLKIVLNDNYERNEREDGTSYFIASGTIVNPTSRTQKIPPILITLKAKGGRPVYSWKMRAKVSSLAPGAKADFSEARLDVPRAAEQISASWITNGE